jgi:hypothetical protein
VETLYDKIKAFNWNLKQIFTSIYLSNNWHGLRHTFSKICTKFDALPLSAPSRYQIRPRTRLHIKDVKNHHFHPTTWNFVLDPQDTSMLVLPPAFASRYNCCTDSTSPENYGCTVVMSVFREICYRPAPIPEAGRLLFVIFLWLYLLYLQQPPMIWGRFLHSLSEDFLNPILFAVCTSTFSKLCVTYILTCRRELSSASLQPIGTRPVVASRKSLTN